MPAGEEGVPEERVLAAEPSRPDKREAPAGSFRSYLPRFLAGYTACAIVLLNTLVLLAGLELLARVATSSRGDPFLAKRASIDDEYRRLYAEKGWGPAFDEMRRYQNQFAYQPYEEHRNRPFTARTIHFSSDGFRAVEGAPPAARRTVMLLGGSTMLGSGSPDGLTIASDLQRMFNARAPGSVRVLNRGVACWFSTQELIHLVGELRAGRVPQDAVFYDGANETGAGVENLGADRPCLSKPLSAFIAGDNEAIRSISSRRGWPGSRLVRLVASYWRAHGLPVQYVPFLEEPSNDRVHPEKDYRFLPVEEREALAQAIFENYANTVRMAETLARSYRFRAHFFWQPSIFPPLHHKRLSALEQRMLAIQIASTYDLWARLERRIRRSKLPVTVLSNAFDDMAETVFLDAVHLTPDGDRRIAEILFKRLSGTPRP